MASQLTENRAGFNDFMDGYYEDENLFTPTLHTCTTSGL